MAKVTMNMALMKAFIDFSLYQMEGILKIITKNKGPRRHTRNELYRFSDVVYTNMPIFYEFNIIKHFFNITN